MQDNYGNECAETVAELRRELQDRESDLRFEYNGRVNAEKKCLELQAERDELQAWQAAVPIKALQEAVDGHVSWHWYEVTDWFATLLAPEAKP